MAEYVVTASNGKKYRVQGPAGVPEEIVRMDIDKQLGRQRMAAQQPRPEPAPTAEPTTSGAVEEFFKGIPRGALDFLETSAIGASALLPERFETPTRQGIASIAETLRAPVEVSPGYEDSVLAQLGAGLGSTVPLLATGLLGTGARLAGIAAAGASGAGIARERAEQGGASEEDRALSTLLGVGPGVAEAVVPFKILDNVIGAVPAQGIVNRLRRAFSAGGQEGLQEAASEVAQNLIAKGIYNPEQGVFTGTGESFGYGAGVGGLIQGIADLVAPTRGVSRTAPPTSPGTTPPAAAAPTPVTPAPTTPPPGTAAPTPAPGSAARPLVPPAVNVDSKLGVAAAIRVQAAELGVTPTQEQAAKIQEIALGSPVDQRPKAIASLLGALAAPTDVVTAVPAEPDVAPVSAVEPAAVVAPDAAPATVEPAPVATPSDLSSVLIGLGVSPRAAVIRGTKGVNVADPVQRQDAVKYLTNYVNNPVAKAKSPEVRAKVMEYVETLKAAPVVEPVVEPTASEPTTAVESETSVTIPSDSAEAAQLIAPDATSEVQASIARMQQRESERDQAKMETALARAAFDRENPAVPVHTAEVQAEPLTENQAAIARLLGEEQPAAPTATQPTPAAKPTEDALVAAKAEFEARGGKTTVVPTGKSGIAPLKSQPVSAQAPTAPLPATTIKSNQALKTKIEQGATPQQVLDHIIRDRNVPQPLRALARAYKTVSANIRYNTAFEPMDGIDVGKFQRYKDKISDMTLTTHKDHDYVQSFLHEHTHALASYAIDVESAAGKRIIELFNIYKKALPNAKDYGLTDAHEFVAEALTNPAFQRAMRRYNVDGNGTSMWQRFVAALKSMIGMKDTDPLLDELLSLTRDAAMSQDIDVPVFIQKKTDEYLAKVMGVESPDAARDALAIQGDIHKRVAPPISSPWYKRAWRQLFEDSKGAMHELIAWSLPMPALNDMAQDQFGRTAPEFAKGVAKITKIFADIEGATARFIQSIDPMKTKIAKFIEAHPDKRQDFNDLYNGGTIAAVDILKPRSTYAGDVDKLKAYDELTAGPWARLANTPGQQLYREVRASHDNQFRRMIDVVRSRMLVTTKDPALAAEVADKFQKLWDTGQLDGYGALMRPEGRYLLTYRVNNIEAQGFEKFDNIEDRDARAAQLNADPEIVPNTVTPFDAIDRDFFEGVAPNSFVGELLKTLKDGNADPALIDNVMRMAISVTPSNALMDRLTKRKNSPGYNEDALTAFLKSTVGLGVRLNNLQYGAETAVALRELTEGFRKAGSKGTAMVKMHNEIKKRVEYASNPAMSELSNLAKAGGYLYTLGGNVSSSLVDMSSLALVTYAQLGSKYGPVKASAAMMRIVPTILRTGTKASIETMVTEGLTGADLQTAMDKAGLTGRDMVEMSAVPSLLNIDFADPNLDPTLRKFEALVNVLKASGHSQRFSTSAEKVEQGASGWLSNLLAHAGFMMNTSERMKREIGIGAHYELELDRVTGGKPETATAAQMEAAANTALEESLLYNGGSTNLMGSRFQQQNLRSVLFMYKRFAVLMMYLQFRMFKRSFSADSDIRGAAHRQLGITLATAALLAGVKGMPLMGPLEDLWNLFADEEEGDEDFETMLRRTLGNTLTEGAINTMTNANVSPRISLTNLLARDTNLPEDATLADQLASHLGGPVFGSLNRVYRGFELYNEGQIQRGVESMMPAALSNLFKTARFGTEGMRTLRGDQVSDVTFGGLAAQALGFAPADYARAMDFTNKQRRVDRSLAARRTNLYEQLYTAYRLGDPAGFQEAMQAMLEFNAAQAAVHPDLLFTPASIKQSLTTRDKNTRDMIMGALPSKTRRAEWEQQWDAWEMPE